MKKIACGLFFTALASVAVASNSLTAAQTAAGWKLLFDGYTTHGWRGYQQREIEPGWIVEAGALTLDPMVAKDIITTEQYENFELTLDWKIARGGNSGVFFHVIEIGDSQYQSGPEYQLLDNRHRDEPPLEQAAALFGLYAPLKDVTKPTGSFNHTRIVVDHGHVEHWLNGVKVVEYQISSPDFKARVAASKFKEWPQFASGQTGHIGLQNHGDGVAFRNIMIRVLK